MHYDTLFSCKQSTTESAANVPIEEINFSSFKLMPNEQPDGLIKSTHYIKLKDTSAKAPFSKISMLKILHQRIYILDTRLRVLIAYDMNGNLIGQVGRRGKGTTEYSQISDFDIDSSGNVYIIDAQADKMKVYDSSYKFLSSMKMPFEADILRCLPDGNFLFGVSSWNKGDNAGNRIVITDNKLKAIHSYFEYDEFKDDSYWISQYKFVSTQNRIFYNKTIDNTVFALSNTGQPVKIYELNFGKMNVPNEDKKKIEENLPKFKNYRLLKDFTIISDKYILGTLWDQYKSRTFIVDRSKKELFLGKPYSARESCNFADFDGRSIISYLYPGKSDISEQVLPSDILDHLKGDKYVICIQDLNSL